MTNNGPETVLPKGMKFQKTYRMNQIGFGLMGLTGVALLLNKTDEGDIGLLMSIAIVYIFLLSIPLFTVLAIKNYGRKYLRVAKGLNYILLAFAAGSNVVGVVMSGLMLNYILSLLMLCIPVIINIYCLNNLIDSQ